MMTGRRAAFRLGLAAEIKAAWYLRLKGYRIVAIRYRTQVGEIDLVAKKGNCLVFVEVKARETLLQAQEAISSSQRRRIAAAARHWLARHSCHTTMTHRFDAVFICRRRWPVHILSAFEMDLG